MGLAVGSDRHLRDHRQIGTVAHGREGGPELGHVAEGLEDESVHSAGHQPLHLPGEGLARLRHRHLAERLDADAQRTDRADHRGAGAGRLAGQGGGRRVDPLGVARQAVGRELHRVGAEGVGLDDLGAGPHVLLVDLPHQAGLLEIELVVADVEEYPPPVEHRAHRPIGDVHPAVGQQLAQSGHASARSGGWAQPALDGGHVHSLPPGVVLHLVAPDLAEPEVLRLGPPEVEPLTDAVGSMA